LRNKGHGSEKSQHRGETTPVYDESDEEESCFSRDEDNNPFKSQVHNDEEEKKKKMAIYNTIYWDYYRDKIKILHNRRLFHPSQIF
jgi:hypothetical protein